MISWWFPWILCNPPPPPPPSPIWEYRSGTFCPHPPPLTPSIPPWPVGYNIWLRVGLVALYKCLALHQAVCCTSANERNFETIRKVKGSYLCRRRPLQHSRQGRWLSGAPSSPFSRWTQTFPVPVRSHSEWRELEH